MIGRRQVVGWGALGLGAFAIDGCNTFPWGKTASTGPGDVERLLAELDKTVLQLKALEPVPERFGIKSDGPLVAEGTAAVKHLMTTLCFLGTYRDVPEAMWQEPRVEARLAKTLPEINTTIRKAREHLAQLDEAHAAGIEKRLRDDPDFTMRIMERVDDYAKQVHVPLEQRTYLRTATSQLAGRFRYEGTKEVTAKLLAKYDHHVAMRKSELGLEGDLDSDTGGGGGEKVPEAPTPLRAQFRTHAPLVEVHRATCGFEPKITVAGKLRQVVLDWEEFRCPTSSQEDPEPIRVGVHSAPGDDGLSIVTVTLYPPASALTDAGVDDVFKVTVVEIAQELQRRVGTPVKVQPPIHPVVESRLGSLGESCRTKADCESPLECSGGSCKSEADRPSSEKLIATTGKIAKWGAILLIPPICAIGALILLVCLFMVIVAGCMYAGGD